MSMLVRLDNGEILPVEGVSFDRKAKTKEKFSMMFDNGWLQLASSALTGADFRVMAILMSRVNWENTVPVETADIARVLDMNPTNVSRSIRNLIESNVFTDTGRKVGGCRVLMLRSSIGWKGKLMALPAADDMRDAILYEKMHRAT